MTFPNYSPTERQFTEGEYPVKVFTSMAGVEFRRIYGAQPFNYRLQLDYTLPNSAIQEFKNHYHSMRGNYRAFNIPSASNVWAAGNGITYSLNPQSSLIQWRYEAPPSISPLPGGAGYSRMNISLVGVISSSFNPI